MNEMLTRAPVLIVLFAKVMAVPDWSTAPASVPARHPLQLLCFQWTEAERKISHLLTLADHLAQQYQMSHSASSRLDSAGNSLRKPRRGSRAWPTIAELLSLNAVVRLSVLSRQH